MRQPDPRPPATRTPLRPTDLLVLALLVTGFLFLAGGYPILALPNAGADDGLFFRAVEHIAQGNWLGPYDKMTLAKGPFLPLVGALAENLGIAAKTLEAMLYAAMALSFSLLAGRLGLSRVLVAALILLLLSNPHFWSLPGRRFLREIVYATAAMTLLAVVVALLNTRSTRSGMLCALGAGVLAGIVYLTREEDIWMQSCIIAVLGAAAGQRVLRGGFASLRMQWRSILIRAACALAGMAVVLPVLALNHAHYGRAIVSEFRAPEFERAVGALMRVGDIHPSGMVPVPQAAMQAVMAGVPAAATLGPVWPQVRDGWAPHGAKLIPDFPGEIAGGWFVWALRDAAARAGHYRSAEDARLFYTRLAEGVNAACDAGRLTCRARRDTLRPELTPARLPELIAAAWRGLLLTVTLSSNPPVAPRSEGSPAALQRWSDVIGPVVTTPENHETVVQGWIAHNAAAPMIALPDRSTLQIRDLQVAPAPDVAAHFRATGADGMQAIRFRMTYLCPDAACNLAAITTGGDSATLLLDAPAQGGLRLGGGFAGHLDGVQTRLPVGLGANPLESARERVLSVFMTGAQTVTPVLVLTATLGLLAYFVALWQRGPGDGWGDGLALLAVGAAVAVIGRCGIIAYIDITSWRALDTTYLGPGYPFVMAYALTGTQLLLRDLRHRMTRRSAAP